jgi:hypothetical protein
MRLVGGQFAWATSEGFTEETPDDHAALLFAWYIVASAMQLRVSLSTC